MASWLEQGWAIFCLRIGFVAAIFLAVFPNGSDGPVAFSIAVISFSTLGALTCFITIRNSMTQRLCLYSLFLIGFFTLCVLLQIVPWQNGAFANSAWMLTAGIGGQDGGTITVAPGTSLAAVPAFVTPVLGFIIAIILFQDDHAARTLVHVLAALGCTLALFGLIRFHVFPEWALFRFPARQGEVFVGNFFNRNTTAAFLSLTLYAVVASLFIQFQRMNMSDLRTFFSDAQRTSPPNILPFFLTLGGALLTLFALFLTQSRAGVVFTLLTLSASFVTIAALKFISAETGGLKLILPVVIPVLAAGIFLIYGPRTILRIEDQGFDEARLCAAQITWRGIQDYPFFGTGFGTYENVFPIYRSFDCGIYGIWERAHNSFLEFYLGLGVPSVLVLLALLAGVCWPLWFGFRNRRRFRSLSVLGFGAGAYIVLHSLIDFPLQVPGMALYFSAVLGAMTAIAIARKTKPYGI